MSLKLNRRSILKTAGAAAAGSALSGPWPVIAQSGPIRIGVTNALSGINAIYGESNVLGQRLVVDEFNKAGGLLGRQIELVVRDDRAQVPQGTALVREFAGSGITFLAGGGSSTVATAFATLMPELKMLYLCSAPGMGITHESFNRNVFRFNPNVYQLFQTLGRAMAERYPNVLKWGSIVPDYAFGHDGARVFGAALMQHHPKRNAKGFEIRKPIVVGGTQTDFRPQINSLMNADTEGLFIGMPGAPEIAFFQQMRAVGLDKKLKAMGEVSGDVALLALGKDLPENVWSIAFWPYELEPVKSNKVSQRLLAAHTAATGKSFPNGHVFRGELGVRALLEAIRKAKSVELDAVIAAMEELSFESAIGPYSVRKADHAGIGPMFAGTYTRIEQEPFIRLKEMRTVSGLSVIETPSPGKEYVM